MIRNDDKAATAYEAELWRGRGRTSNGHPCPEPGTTSSGHPPVHRPEPGSGACCGDPAFCGGNGACGGA